MITIIVPGLVMPEESTRRLAAIMMGDIAGYSRLMGADERGTHVRVQRLLRELIDPTIAEHRGRVIRVRGDGFLAMFDSPVEAVRCAIVIQQSMVGRNLELPNAQWIRFRIGVNLGDVIVDHDDVYGEGVNVAARLEQLAEPGNIYISGGVYEQIRYKLVCGYQSLGDRKVKNILDPVPIYRVLPDPAALAKAARGGKVRLGLLGAGTIIAVGIGAGGWYIWDRVTQPPSRTVAARTPAPAQTVMPSPPAAAPVVAPEQRVSPPAQATPAPDPPATAATTSPAAPNLAPPPPAPNPAPADQLQAAAVPPRPEIVQPEAAQAVAAPEMVAIAGGTFRMGSNEDPSEQPVHAVTVGPFQMAKYLVTVRQWRGCVRAKACSYVPTAADDAPVNNVSWADAQQFVTWLSQATQQHYRLPSEAEWEYAARAGTDTRYWWGNAMKPGLADCKGCGAPSDAVQPAKVGALPANPFGLHDIGGGLAEWVVDCWHKDYHGAPADGSAWPGADCRERVLRGGSWRNDPSYVRSASRDFYDASVRYPTHGVRLARSP
jgi:formylglycine-generating enzyme required for sulfatase activity/class 3 adenylate cyclase